ncbi:hypothetical protein [Alicyclobacillus suci]|uniref:hypothetical protein n=1 Tax=Alicyclobacillus suci TaxID=2816080 RepID=UPI001A8EDCAB|nr:hypothetical protein [Alicyclobacillus suci]
MNNGRVLSVEEVYELRDEIIASRGCLFGGNADETVMDLITTIRVLQRQVSELTDLLTICQWSNDHYCGGYCKVCGNAEEDGHKADCCLAKALKQEVTE